MKTEKQNTERELTGKESCICFAVLIVMLLLAAIPEGDYSVTAGIRMALSIVLGICMVLWQHKRINTPLDKEDKDGE